MKGNNAPGVVTSCLLLILLFLSGCSGQTEAPTQPHQPTSMPKTDEELGKQVLPTVTTAPTDEGIVAEINGSPIMREQWEQQVARVHDYLQQEASVDDTTSEGRTQLRQAARQILEEMIDEVLIRQAAERRGLSISPGQLDEVIARDIESAGGQEKFDEWLKSNRMTLADYREATELQLLTNDLREQITSEIPVEQPQINLRHILLPSEERAAEVLQKLESGIPFDELATTYSIDPGTQNKGGVLGWLPKDVLPLSVEEVAWQLAPGERSGIVESEFGFHIVEVIEQDRSRPLTLELLQTLQQRAWERWLAHERANASIERWLNY